MDTDGKAIQINEIAIRITPSIITINPGLGLLIDMSPDMSARPLAINRPRPVPSSIF